MKIGDERRVKLIERVTDTKAHIVDIENGKPGVLMIKGQLRVRKDGIVNAWLIQQNGSEAIYGNAYFGKFDISRSLANRYIVILKKLFDNPQALIADDLSCLKGIANRCLKKDQWDWFTTYTYLGYPAHPVLRKFVADTVVQRDLLRQGRYEDLSTFRRTHHAILSSILFHLSENSDVDADDIDIPVSDIDQDLWVRMSLDSRKNIKMAERIYAKSSLYTLMHYFVALEQEFHNHLVQPFADSYGHGLLRVRCRQERFQRTHDILTGRSPFTLGTVRFLGDYVRNHQACEDSPAIQQFSDFLGSRRSEFAVLCSLIATQSVGAIALPQLRNALAHGDESITSRIDGTTFDRVRSLLLHPPERILPRILSNSLRYPEPA